MGNTLSVADPTTGGTTFQFQGVDTNNAILLAGDGNGATTATYSLSQAAGYTSLSFLAADGNGAATIGVTLNYVGGGSSQETLNVGDWFNGSPVAISANGRINNGGYDSVNSGNPNLYYYDITGLSSANQVLSISFSFDNGANGNSRTAIYGISGSTPVLFPANGLTWTGATNNNWSVSAADTNWTGGAAFTNGTGVNFDDTAVGNTTIKIAAGGVQPSTVLFNNNVNSYSFSGGAISGTASVTLSGSGTVTFNSPNTYSGGTFVNAGTLVDTNGAALGSGVVTIGPPGTVQFTSANASINGLSGPGSVVLGNASVGPTSLTINGTTNTTFSGSISEAGGSGVGNILTKAGTSSTLTLLGNSSYSGGTNINQGAVAAAATSLGSGPVTLANGTKLSLVNAVTQSGFSGMTTNGNAVVAGGVLTLSNGGGYTSSSFTRSSLPIGANGFAASFVYQDVGGGGADGATFCIQSTAPRLSLAAAGPWVSTRSTTAPPSALTSMAATAGREPSLAIATTTTPLITCLTLTAPKATFPLAP